MTLQEFQKKYNFSEDLSKRDLKAMIANIMIFMLEIGMRDQDSNDKPKIEIFLDDAKSLFI